MRTKIRLLPVAEDPIDLYDIASIRRHIKNLKRRRLNSPDAIERWLADWSDYFLRVYEAGSAAHIEWTRDNKNEDKKALHEHYQEKVSPILQRAADALHRRLLETGWTSQTMAVPIAKMKADVRVFRASNVPLLTDMAIAENDYGETVGALEAEFDGKVRTVTEISGLYLLTTDRGVREQAWNTARDLFAGVRPTLDDLFDRLVALRTQIALNAGFVGFEAYQHMNYNRLDYTPGDVQRFHAAMRVTGVPAMRQIYEMRRLRLGLDTLRPWDLSVDMYGDRMQPFTNGRQLLNGAVRVFTRLDPEFGKVVRFMRDNDLLDLSNRRGKNPGGYQGTLHHRNWPFIFMNAIGTPRDIQVMLHESGHAFHTLRSSRQPLMWQRWYPLEFGEVASFSMELIAGEYLETANGGFYNRRDFLRARLDAFLTMLRLLPWISTIDAFQHWVYEHPTASHEERASAWLQLHELYMNGPDWSGLEDTRSYEWHRQLHPFEVPFYYIEYGLAWLGALQVWRNWRENSKQALEMWLEALSLGGTADLPTLYATAGAKLVFDESDMGPLVQLMVNEIMRLDAELDRTPA